MNDLTPEELDELASAYLDSETTAEERAIAEADPALLARVEQFRQAASEVASPVTEVGREEIISKALELSVETKANKLRAWLERDRLRNPQLVPIFSVAAVIIVAFLAISIIVLLGDDTGDDSDAVESLTTSAATQASESDQFLESADFQAALDERLDEMSTALVTTSAPAAAQPAAAQLASPTETADEASADDAFAPATTSAAAAQPAAAQLASPPPAAIESNGFAEARTSPSTSPSIGECLTEENLAAPSEDDDSEGSLEEEEEPAPGDPDAIERSDSPPPDSRPATELEVPTPPSVRPSPPPAGPSAASSNTIPSDREDAPFIECP